MKLFKLIFNWTNLIIGIVLAALLAVSIFFFPTAQASNDIRATFPNARIQYESFVPAIPRWMAISIARTDFATGYHQDANKYPVNATVALYTGPFMGPGGGILTDKQVWIVVISGLPYSDTGPPSPIPFTSVSQLNFAIDAKTGIIIHEVLSGRRIYQQ